MTNKVFRKILVFSVLALAAGAVSCVKEQELESAPALPRISFRPGLLSVDISGPGTRASYADSAPREEVVALSGGDSSSQPLYLHISASARKDDEQDQVATRAGEGGGLSGHDSFGVYGFSYRESETIDSAAPIMSDVKVSEETSSTGSWAPSSGDYRWPGSGRMVRFYAYAPHGAAGIETPTPVTTAPPTLTYAVPSTPDAQTDLLAGSSAELSGDGTTTSATVSFSHALTGIRFVVGDDMLEGTVVSIAVKNVYGSATLTPGATTLWSRHASPSTYPQDIEFEVNADTRGKQMGKTLYLLPQTLPSGAAVEVSFIDNVLGLQSTFSASLAGKTWNAGELITFSVSTSSIKTTPVINLSKSTVNFQYTGGTDKYTIESYNLITGLGNQQIKVPADYTVEYYGYNESTGAYDVKLSGRPEWLTEFGGDGKGTTSAKEFSVTCAPQTAVEVLHPNEKRLREAPERGSERSPYDLSMHYIWKNDNYADAVRPSGMTTANCYLVFAPGWYKFPLVYGNAIVNGKLNPSSYTGSGTNALANFVNHTGNAITSPYLSDNEGVVPSKAELLWSDFNTTGVTPIIQVKSSISTQGVVIDESVKRMEYISFYVPRENIHSGNAVIAVKDDAGTILWSWHIWVTSNSYRQWTGQGEVLGLYYILKWEYPTRNIKVRFTQKDKAFTKEFSINQVRGEVVNNNPPDVVLYNWGRKDPFPSKADKDTDRKVYCASSFLFDNSASGNVDYSEEIKHPMTNRVRYSVGGGPKSNLWDVSYTDYAPPSFSWTFYRAKKLVKSVYDPCPPGTMMYGLAQVYSSFNNKAFSNATSSVALKDVYSYYQWTANRGYSIFSTTFSRSPNFGENYNYLNTANVWMPHSFSSGNRSVGGGVSVSAPVSSSVSRNSGYMYCGVSFTSESQLPVIFQINDTY